MGFFSSLCEACEHPVLCPGAVTPGVNGWMCDVVAIQADGAIHIGEYDGYGRVGGADGAVGFDSTVYHRACWELEGSPLDYIGNSRHAEDQGWFFDDEHDLLDPRQKV